MKILLTTLALLSWATLAAQTEKSATPLTTQNSKLNTQNSTRAVVVGISDYQDSGIPDLRFADRDAEAFANFLRSPGGGSLSSENLHVLINQDATAGQVIAALTWLLDESKPGDQAIIYFSGHGDVEAKLLNQLGFLLLWDSPAHAYLAGALPVDMLRQVVSTLSIEQKTKVFVVVDACRAGKLAGNTVIGTQLTSSQLAQQFSQEQKILSCQPNEFSIEGEQWGGGRGVFSYHLCNGLYGLADGDRDGQVSMFEIGRYLEDRVPREVSPLSQLPLTVGDRTGTLFPVDGPTLATLEKLGTPPPIIAHVEQRGMLQEALAKADTSIRFWYAAFERTLAEKKFFEPEDTSTASAQDCAEFYYQKLCASERIAALRPMLNRNYAAALQDDAQQALNTWLKTGLTADVLSGAKKNVIYRNYPAYLERAARLLGSNHYMYAALQSRRYFFEAIIRSEPAEKRENFFRALEWQPDQAHVYDELAGTFEAELADSAIFYATKAMQLAPSWPMPCLRLSDFYGRKAREVEKEAQWLERASEADSSSLLVWYMKARFHFKYKRYEQAEYWFKKTIAGSGNSICFPCAHNDLGNMYQASIRYEEAAMQYAEAIRLDSAFVYAYVCLGALYYNQGRMKEAEQPFIQAIRLDSTFSYAYNNLGNLYLISGRYSEAEQLFKKALRLDSAYAFAYANLFQVYEGMERYDEAEAMLIKAISLAPGFVGFNIALGRMYLKTGRLEDAEKTFRKELSLAPEFADVFVQLAIVAVRRQQTAQAWAHLENACKLGFQDVDFLQSDEDLAPLRALPEWKALMKKHFPDKVKD